MTLEAGIAEAQSDSDNPPKNESNTCDWVILPLLRAAGYALRDIESRIVDSTGQFPDYTILPHVPDATWYLEAKSWNVALEDNHAKQALNYANHNGKRFVVLTNGQIWRFYDNSIQGLLAAKLIVEASLHDTPAITNILAAVSKAQALSGGLERFAAETSAHRRQQALETEERRLLAEEEQRQQRQQAELRSRLDSEMADQLRDSASELVQTVTLYMNVQRDFKELLPRTLALWFGEILSRPPDDSNHASSHVAPEQVGRHLRSEQTGEKTVTLKALHDLPIDGKSERPIALETPDGKLVAVRYWVDIAEQAVHWLLQQSRPMPIPFEHSRPTRWFVNNNPVHKRKEQRARFATISTNGKTVYMDKDREGREFLKDIHALCLAMQIPPEGFRITMLG